MKTMRFHIFFSSLCACLMACGGSSSGNIDITTTSALDAAQTAQISQFVFVVSDPNATSAGSVLYPSECLSTCTAGQEACPDSGICLSNTVCGFDAGASTFDPNISFDDFPQDSTIAVRICGLDENGQVIGSGINQLANTDGASTSITVSSSAECGGLPTACP